MQYVQMNVALLYNSVRQIDYIPVDALNTVYSER